MWRKRGSRGRPACGLEGCDQPSPCPSLYRGVRRLGQPPPPKILDGGGSKEERRRPKGKRGVTCPPTHPLGFPLGSHMGPLVGWCAWPNRPGSTPTAHVSPPKSWAHWSDPSEPSRTFPDPPEKSRTFLKLRILTSYSPDYSGPHRDVPDPNRNSEQTSVSNIFHIYSHDIEP